MKSHLLLLAAMVGLSLPAATLPPSWSVADTNLAEYFRRETRALSEKCLSDIQSADDWKQHAPEYRAQLGEMLGLAPLPPRTGLKATVKKRFEHDTFTVENLHFQSRPGLYVTANLYVPKNLTKPAPTILYVCGHGPVISNNVSYGTKAGAQQYGVWFARNGYVCLIIDTLESGEILGEHHGTYRQNMWWWNSRGYTPGGVECWNGMRALDYLSTRPEVDTNRFGITGRSGGGAYSWYVTAMDDRIKAAAPTAGITDLENHVVDGAVEGHCDCMFFVNTYRWDYPQLAALAAPRPLLICNTDDDNIFPLDGVVRLRDKVRRVYDLLGAGEKCGLVITPGPHKDTQELQVPVMRWFNRHLKGEETLIENAAVKLFSPQQLKVFDTLPGDAVNARIHETFVEAAGAEVPKTKEEWNLKRDAWLEALGKKSFAAWPPHPQPATFTNDPFAKDIVVSKSFGNVGDYPVVRETGNMLRLKYSFMRRSDRFTLRIEDSTALLKELETVLGYEVISNMMVRVAWPGDAKKFTQLRRRFMLLGATVDSARVWEIVHLIHAARAQQTNTSILPARSPATIPPLSLEAEGDMAVNALYASLFAPVDELVLTHLPTSHTNGPDYLNVLRILDIPQAVAMASERGRVILSGANEADWQYPLQTAKQLGWEKNLRLVQ